MHSDTEHVYVALGERSYEIEIGTGNLPRLGPFTAARLRPTACGDRHRRKC